MYIYVGLLASVIGLGISFYIHRKKREQSKLFCPLRTQCEKVVHSDHSKVLGLPVEVLGILYYALVGIFYAGALFSPSFVTPEIQLIQMILVSFGAAFSLYLLFLQAFTIRAWCVWCLLSMFANVALVVSLFSFDHVAVFSLLGSQRIWWIVIHNIGFILGIGGATITDVFFFRFMKNKAITKDQKETMDTLSAVIWAGLIILILSGLALYLPAQERLNVSAKFLIKVIVVGVVFVNGLLLNIFVGPKLDTLSFEKTPLATKFRRLAFALGGVSLTSWYIAFLLGSFRRIDITLQTGVLIYAAILLSVIIGSQIFERIIIRKNQSDVIHREGGQGNNETL